MNSNAHLLYMYPEVLRVAYELKRELVMISQESIARNEKTLLCGKYFERAQEKLTGIKLH